VHGDAFIDEVIARFKQQGGRSTRARRAILTAMVEREGEHSSADELTEIVQRNHPDVAPSTIYRFLDELEQMGVVDHVQPAQGGAVYHLAEHSHDHLLCTNCGKVIEVPTGALEPLRALTLREFGFRISRRHFAISGLCRECADLSPGNA
jgi:Fur family transcriptional regulator, ferric uptake regulator